MCFQAMKILSCLIYFLYSTQPPTVVLQKLGVTMNDIWKLSFQFYAIYSVGVHCIFGLEWWLRMERRIWFHSTFLYFLPWLYETPCSLEVYFVPHFFFIYIFNTCEFSQQPLVWNYWSWGNSLLGVHSKCYRTLTHKQTCWGTQTKVVT